MNENDAIEQAYRNGYEDGKRDAVKHGTWVAWWNDDYLSYCHMCSECGEYPLTKEETVRDEVLSDYCPSCGAKMDRHITKIKCDWL